MFTHLSSGWPDDGIVLPAGLDLTSQPHQSHIMGASKVALDLIVADALLPDVLAVLGSGLEAQDPALQCSITTPAALVGDVVTLGRVDPRSVILLDDAAASQPFLTPEAEVLHAGALRNVSDVSLETRWSERWRDGLLQRGVRACAVVPVHAPDGTTIAAISLHAAAPGYITRLDPALIDLTRQLAAVAIERCRTAERLRRADAAAETLRAEDARKDLFLATLAHELRNPLAPMLNGLQMMQLSNDPAVLRSAQEILGRQVTQLMRLVDELLDLSRIRTGKIELRRGIVPVADVVQLAIEMAQPIVAQMQHELCVQLPAERVLVLGDGARLAQVVFNLVNNAAKYSECNGRVSLVVTATESEVEVTVSDTGIGLAPEQLGRIFDMFIQIDESLTKSRGGLGIGLTLVRQIVHLHDGSVHATSDGIGHGAQFRVRLPRVSDATPPDASPDIG